MVQVRSAVAAATSVGTPRVGSGVGVDTGATGTGAADPTATPVNTDAVPRSKKMTPIEANIHALGCLAMAATNPPRFVAVAPAANDSCWESMTTVRAFALAPAVLPMLAPAAVVGKASVAVSTCGVLARSASLASRRVSGTSSFTRP